MAQAATRVGGHEVADAGGRELVVGAGAAGLAGGLAMAVVLAIGGAIGDADVVAQLRAVGLTFLGPDAADAGAALLAWGLLLHLVVSVLLAIVFAWILPVGFPFGSAAVVGIGYAWVVMAITTSAFLPAVNPTLRDEMTALGGTWVLAHAAFGLALGLGPRLRQRLGAGA